MWTVYKTVRGTWTLALNGVPIRGGFVTDTEALAFALHDPEGDEVDARTRAATLD